MMLQRDDSLLVGDMVLVKKKFPTNNFSPKEDKVKINTRRARVIDMTDKLIVIRYEDDKKGMIGSYNESFAFGKTKDVKIEKYIKEEDDI